MQGKQSPVESPIFRLYRWQDESPTDTHADSAEEGQNDWILFPEKLKKKKKEKKHSLWL